jgi:cell shape-determining protein MreD
MLKNFALYVGITACLLFIQSSALLPLGNQGIRPDLLLFLVLNAAVTLPVVPCACIVFIIGYALEALSGSPAGLFISSYLLIFATIILLRRFYNFYTRLEMFGLLLLCLIVKYALLSFFLFFVYEYRYNELLQTILRETFFTSIVFPLLFPLIHYAFNHGHTPGPLSAQKHSHGA